MKKKKKTHKNTKQQKSDSRNQQNRKKRNNKINKTKSWFLEKINAISKTLARLTKNKRKVTNYQYQKLKRDIITDPTDTEKITKEY